MDNQSQHDDSFRARWVRISADMLEHDAFAGEPYSKHAAWLWLIANAAWKPRRFKAPNVNAMVELERGQVLAARHYLADKWQWSEKKVRNFLAFLLSQNMIEMGQSKGRFANVVTVCNYDKYQSATQEKGQLNGQFGASSGPVEGQTLTRDTNTTSREDTPLPPSGAVRVEKPLPKFGKLEALEAFNAYNAVALRCALPQAAKLTPNRERSIVARLKDYGLDGWHRALANIEQSKFLTGGTDQGFRADLDFVCQAKSFGKLHDGGYGNGRHSTHAQSTITAPKSAGMREFEIEAWKEKIGREMWEADQKFIAAQKESGAVQ